MRMLLCHIYLGGCVGVVAYLNGWSFDCCFIVFFSGYVFLFFMIFSVFTWVVLCHIVFDGYALVVVSYYFRYIFS